MFEPDEMQILALTEQDAPTLFPGDARWIDHRFRALARRFHPDCNHAADAARVFAKLVALRDAAKRRLAMAIDTETLFDTIDGRSFERRWQTRHATDLGQVLVGENVIAHIVPAEFDDLAGRADALTLRFADARMKRALAPFLPRRIATLRTADGMAFIERKAPGEFLLRDLMRLRPIDPRHAAWITTRLVNLAAYLQWAGFAHGAIGPDTLLVSPADHTLALTGPFLCAAPFGTKPPALPARTLASAPRYGFADAAADDALDPELVRQSVRELLGDPAGTSLAADPAFPKPFAAWLLMPPADGAQSDFRAWEYACDASFGARRFIPWDIDAAALRTA